jgi:nicotinamidase-related amidase
VQRPLRSAFTRDNTALLLIDYQPGFLHRLRMPTSREVLQRATGLARAARALDIPVIATTIARDRGCGPMAPDLAAVVGHGIDRIRFDAWSSGEMVAAVERTGRRHLIIAGALIQTSAALPAISATAEFYKVLVPVDACGSVTGELDSGSRRLAKFGIEVSDSTSSMLEVMGSAADPSAESVYTALGF